MATSNADGSIVLSTKVDVSGTRQGFKQIANSARQAGNQTESALEPLTAIIQKQEKRLQYLNNTYAELIVNGKKNTNQAKLLRKEIDNLSKEMKDNQAVATAMGTKGATAIQKISSALKVAVGYFVGIQTIMSAIGFSKEASNLAVEQEANVQRLIDIYGAASEEVGNFIDLNARALGMSKTAAAGFSAVYGNLFSVWADQATNAELTNQYLNMTAVIASKTGRTVEDVQERIRSGLLGNTEAIEDLGIFVNVKTIEMTEAFQRVADGRSWEQLTAYEQSQVRTLAILEQSTKKYGNEVADTNALVRAQFFASYQDLQETWGQFINTVLVPVLRVATQVINVFIVGLQTIANMTGQVLEGAQGVENAVDGALNNQGDFTDEVRKTNKELNKTLASFDELSTLQNNQPTNSGGLLGGADIDGSLFGELNPNKIASEINSTLLSIMAVVGVALIAIGVILIAFGNVAWGIGFIIAGAAVFGVVMATLKSGKVSQKVREEVNKAITIAGIVAIVLGILCCVAQRWGIGLGLIVLGAGVLVTEVVVNWNTIEEKLQGPLGDALVVVGIIAVVLGILCCCAQHWALGIGLIVFGAGDLVLALKAKWHAIKDRVEPVVEDALVIIGVISIVIGIICCCAQQWGLGVALIVEGVLSLDYGTKDWNADTFIDKLAEIWLKVERWLVRNVFYLFSSEFWAALGGEAFGAFFDAIGDEIDDMLGDLIGETKGKGGVKTSAFIDKFKGAGKIPGLARGTVLPPNKPFLALVGDQKHGTNIEAPLDTIVDAFNIALSSRGDGGGQIVVPVYLNGREIALAVRDSENEMGSQTVVGGFANAY